MPSPHHYNASPTAPSLQHGRILNAVLPLVAVDILLHSSLLLRRKLLLHILVAKRLRHQLLLRRLLQSEHAADRTLCRPLLRLRLGIDDDNTRPLFLLLRLVLLCTLLLGGTLLLKTTEDVSWLGAFFQSVSARTAGFSTYPIGEFTNAGLFTLIVLMFIGASPGSTGGGIKTSTFFVLLQHVRSLFTKQHIGAFHRSISFEMFSKACTITLLSMLLVCVGTFLLCVLEPKYSFVQLLFEEVSAFGTVGLSTGITPDLGVASKLVLIFTMFAGRVGAFTLLTIWIDRPLPNIRYTEESITIG